MSIKQQITSGLHPFIFSGKLLQPNSVFLLESFLKKALYLFFQIINI